MTSRFTEEEIREAQQYYLKICDGIRAMPGLQDVVAVQETHKEQVTDPRDEVIKVLREGLSFYSDLMPYIDRKSVV